MISRRFVLNACRKGNSLSLCRQYSSTRSVRSISTDTDLRSILDQVSHGKLTPSESEAIIRRQFEKDLPFKSEAAGSPDEVLKSFADIDHTRGARTGFPEAVFGAGKTPNQIAMILDDMARNFNEKAAQPDGFIENSERAILATRYVKFSLVSNAVRFSRRKSYHLEEGISHVKFPFPPFSFQSYP